MADLINQQIQANVDNQSINIPQVSPPPVEASSQQELTAPVDFSTNENIDYTESVDVPTPNLRSGLPEVSSQSLPEFTSTPISEQLYFGPSRQQLVRAGTFALPRIRTNTANQLLQNPRLADRNYLFDSRRNRVSSFLERVVGGFYDYALGRNPGEPRGLFGNNFGDFGSGGLGRLFYTLGLLPNVSLGAGADIGREVGARLEALNLDDLLRAGGNWLRNPFDPNNRQQLNEALGSVRYRDLAAQANVFNPALAPLAQFLESPNFRQRRAEFYELTEDGEYLPYFVRALRGDDLSGATFQRQLDNDFNPYGVLGDAEEFERSLTPRPGESANRAVLRTWANYAPRFLAGLAFDIVSDPFTGPANDIARWLTRSRVAEVIVTPPTTPQRMLPAAPDTPPSPMLPGQPQRLLPGEGTTIDIGQATIEYRQFRPIEVRGLPAGIEVQQLDSTPVAVPRGLLVGDTVDQVLTPRPVRRRVLQAIAPQEQWTDVAQRALVSADDLNIRPRSAIELRRVVNAYDNIISTRVRNVNQIEAIVNAIPDKALREYLQLAARPIGRPVPMLPAASDLAKIDTTRLINQLDRPVTEYTENLARQIDQLQDNPESINNIPWYVQSGLQRIVGTVNPDNVRLPSIVASSGAVFYADEESFIKYFDPRVLELGDITPDTVPDPGYVEEMLTMIDMEVDMLQATEDIPYVVNMISYERNPDGTGFIELENVQGRTLYEYLNSEDFNDEQYYDIITRVIDLSQDFYDRGFVHYDLHPGNIMVDDNFDIKFIDLGLSSRAMYHYSAASDLRYSQQLLEEALYDIKNKLLPEVLPELTDVAEQNYSRTFLDVSRIISDRIDEITRIRTEFSTRAYNEVRLELADDLRAINPTREIRARTDDYLAARESMEAAFNDVTDLEAQLHELESMSEPQVFSQVWANYPIPVELQPLVQDGLIKADGSFFNSPRIRALITNTLTYERGAPVLSVTFTVDGELSRVEGIQNDRTLARELRGLLNAWENLTSRPETRTVLFEATPAGVSDADEVMKARRYMRAGFVVYQADGTPMTEPLTVDNLENLGFMIYKHPEIDMSTLTGQVEQAAIDLTTARATNDRLADINRRAQDFPINERELISPTEIGAIVEDADLLELWNMYTQARRVPSPANIQQYWSQFKYTVENQLEDAHRRALAAYDTYENVRAQLAEETRKHNELEHQRRMEQLEQEFKNRDDDLGNGNRSSCL